MPVSLTGLSFLFSWTCILLILSTWFPIHPSIIHFLCAYYVTRRVSSLKQRQKTQFSSVQSLSHIWLCDPMDCRTPGLPVHHQLPEFTQSHVHWVSDAIQPSHPLSSPSSSSFNLSKHQSLFQWISSLHQVAKVLEFQLQHQSFQWTPRTDFL